MDAKLEFLTGFPYQLSHASALGAHLIELLYPVAPKKGLITDLDDTLWAGIVGEIGAEAVSWDQAHHSQIHGFYQQMLGQLADMGVLLAIASKNEPAVAQEALRQPDLLMPYDAFFPVVADWKPKSRAVSESLETWNIGAESVVFVDDSPMELDEVQSTHPVLHEEDRLRQTSIRTSAQLRAAGKQSDISGFIRELRGKITFDCRKDRANTRLLELINKTNQFNLNGARLAEGDWQRHLQDEAGFTIGVSYEDKFGPLGTIGVVAGRRDGSRVSVTNWVLSCRAFSRKIEHHTLDYLFRKSNTEEIAFAFRPTERNKPLQEFFKEFPLACESEGELSLSREQVLRRFELPHEVNERLND